MSRPKPTVLLQHSNKSTFKMDEVLAAEGIWAVFYDGKPINLKSSSLVANYPGPKYKKVSFSNPGHAENLAKKLNAQHNTDKFGVYLLKSGEKFSRYLLLTWIVKQPIPEPSCNYWNNQYMMKPLKIVTMHGGKMCGKVTTQDRYD